MKVSELFEAQGEPGQGGKLQGGAFYKPAYRDDVKQLRGSVKDWLDAMKVTPADVTKAIARVKASPLFRNELPKAGLHLDAEIGSGTLKFKAETELPNGKKHNATYNIYANGQIRWTGARGWGGTGEYTSPLQSPKPRMKQGDPVGSIVMIYTAAAQELMSKWKKTVEKLTKAANKEKLVKEGKESGTGWWTASKVRGEYFADEGTFKSEKEAQETADDAFDEDRNDDKLYVVYGKVDHETRKITKLPKPE